MNPAQISLGYIRGLVTSVGYDADDQRGDTTAYEGLPACCKKDGGHK